MPRAKGSLGHRAYLAACIELLSSHAGLANDGAAPKGGFEPVSFGMGVVVAFCIFWVLRLPWGRLAERFGEAFRAWRRNTAMMLFAAALFGVLLLY